MLTTLSPPFCRPLSCFLSLPPCLYASLVAPPVVLATILLLSSFFSLTLLSSSILHAKTVLYHCARAGFSVSHTPLCHACGNEIYCLCLAICSTLITCARLCLASKLLSLWPYSKEAYVFGAMKQTLYAAAPVNISCLVSAYAGCDMCSA